MKKRLIFNLGAAFLGFVFGLTITVAQAAYISYTKPGTVSVSAPITGDGVATALTCQDASGTQGGCVTTGAQTIAGVKTLTGQLVSTTSTSPSIDLSGVTGATAIRLKDQGVIDGPQGLAANVSLKIDNTIDGSFKMVGSLIVAGGWYVSSDSYDVGAGLRNRSATVGGAVPVQDVDGMRFVSTGVAAIIESDTAATGGTDYAFVMRPTATLAATDAVLEVRNAANAALLTIFYDGSGAFSGSKTRGTITLSAGSGTATVNSGAICVCTDTTANASVKCAVATTTLTATGTGTDVIAYICL